MLTRRKQEFIQYYLKTKNATQSAKLAGYSQRTAYSQGQRLLKKVEVAERVAAGFRELDEAMNITDENIRKNLLKEAYEAKRAADRIRAWELLGKDRGMFREHSTIVGVNLYQKYADDFNRLQETRLEQVTEQDSKVT